MLGSNPSADLGTKTEVGRLDGVPFQKISFSGLVSTRKIPGVWGQSPHDVQIKQSTGIILLKTH